MDRYLLIRSQVGQVFESLVASENGCNIATETFTANAGKACPGAIMALQFFQDQASQMSKVPYCLLTFSFGALECIPLNTWIPSYISHKWRFHRQISRLPNVICRNRDMRSRETKKSRVTADAVRLETSNLEIPIRSDLWGSMSPIRITALFCAYIGIVSFS